MSGHYAIHTSRDVFLTITQRPQSGASGHLSSSATTVVVAVAHCACMSLSLPGFEDSPGWGAPVETEDDVVTAAIKKEKVIKCVPYDGSIDTLVDCPSREIAAQQEDLRGKWQAHGISLVMVDHSITALLARVKGVQTDVDKLASGNETLQMYIDNLTLQMAKRR